jgi:hypothetical protein
MKDESTKFRRSIWGTTLGVRVKITLLALWEVGDIQHNLLVLPPNVFRRVSVMIGRSQSSVVGSIEQLVGRKILKIDPIPDGYAVHFYPENEIRYNSREKQKAAIK